MRLLTILTLSLALPFLACSKDKEKDGKNSDEKGSTKAVDVATASPMVKQLAALADQGCACTDHACTKKVDAAVAKFAKSIKKVEKKDMAPMQAAQKRLDECTVKYNPFIISYKKLGKEVCACKDKACAEASAVKYKAWIAKLKATKGAVPRGHLPAVMTHGKAAAACFKKHGVPLPQ